MDFHSPTSPALLFLYQNMKLHWSDLAYSLAKCVHFSGHQKDFFVFESWWIWMICVGKNSRVSEESQRTLHVAPVRKQSNVLFSHLGSLRLWQDRFARRHPLSSFIIQGGEAFCSFAALGFIFPYHTNRSLGFSMRDSFRTHKATPDSWYMKWEMCQDPEYKL